MNTEKKIKQHLRAAPKPLAPNGLLDKLKADVSTHDIRTQRSSLRRWFAPTGGPVSRWRIAAAAAIAIAVLLPLTYGATKAAKYFITTFEATFEYPDDNVVYKISNVTTTSGDNIQTEEDARKAEEEFYQLYKEGKAVEIEPGIWHATLSSGVGFGYGGDPEHLGLSEVERKKLLKKQFNEIHELGKAGRFEKIYKPEHDLLVDGVKHRYFEARYTLSNGKVVTLGASEPAEDQEDKD